MSNQYEKSVYAHRRLVKQLTDDMCLNLAGRGQQHDLSKFSPEEQGIYERVTPKFQGVAYGTPEYEAVKSELGPALEHHYRVNDHHIEHFEHGVEDMNAMQLCEMIADVYAATMRSEAPLIDSINTWCEKYSIEPQLRSIIFNTIIWLRNGAM